MFIKNEVLYHHGIKGQKWGVRNGPPYPLSESVSSSIKSTKTPLTKSEKQYIKNTLFLTDEELDKVTDVALKIGVSLAGTAGVVAAGYLAASIIGNANLGAYALRNAPLLTPGFNSELAALKPFALGDKLFSNRANGSYIGTRAEWLGYGNITPSFISEAISNPTDSKFSPDNLLRFTRLLVADYTAPRRLSCWSASNAYYMSVLTGHDFTSKSFENLVDFNDFGKLYKTLPDIFNIDGKKMNDFVGRFGRFGTSGNEETAKQLVRSIFKNISSNNLDPSGKTTIGFINAAYHDCTCTHQWNFEILRGIDGIKTLFISDGYVGKRYPVAKLNVNKVTLDSGFGTLVRELGHYNSKSIRFYAPALDSINPDMLAKIILGKGFKAVTHSDTRSQMNNELYHYGVLGMKWGVRRYQPYSTVPRESGKGGREIGDAKRTKKALKKDIKKVLKNKQSDTRQMIGEYRKAMGANKQYHDSKNLERELNERIYVNSNAADNLENREAKGFEKVANTVVAQMTRNEVAKMRTASDKARSDAQRHASRTGKRYVRKLNESLLKDIGYKGNIDEGLKFLEAYKQAYYISDSGLIRRRGGIFGVGNRPY